ncbi:hypothetical protein L2E82_01038 [Cichorium intybus]|uniref:Uncharacterized protein n=1 Tax=Cichorium intybus TaxID=13427 RepID=A0ACB9GYL6_CICIN|nr:hypothetical protein L2E82_01038 [Cichorium intybus]
MSFGRLCLLSSKMENLNANSLMINWKNNVFKICIQEDGDWSPPFLNDYKKFEMGSEVDSDGDVYDKINVNQDDENSEDSDDDIRSTYGPYSSNEDVVVPDSTVGGGMVPDKNYSRLDGGSKNEAEQNFSENSDNVNYHTDKVEGVNEKTNSSFEENNNERHVMGNNDNCHSDLGNPNGLGSINGPLEKIGLKPNTNVSKELPNLELPDLNDPMNHSECTTHRKGHNRPKSVKFIDIIRASNQNKKGKKSKGTHERNCSDASSSETWHSWC